MKFCIKFFSIGLLVSIYLAIPTQCISQNNKIEFEHITILDGLSQSSGYCILEDNLGFIWIGTSDGLNRYDGKSFKIFKEDIADSNSIISNLIYSSAIDKNGFIWVGTQKGLCKIEYTSSGCYQFKKFTHDSKNSNSISGNDVRCVFIDSKGILWIGTFDGGLCTFNQVTEKFTSFGKNSEIKNDISGQNIWKIYEDRTGLIWIGSFTGGLFCYFRDTGIFKNFVHSENNYKSISGNNVQAITEDHLGNLWIGTYGNGLNILTSENRKKGEFLHLNFEKGKFTSNDLIYSIFEDSKHRIWVGTENNGTKMLQLKSQLDIFSQNKFNSYSNNPLDPTSINGNQIWTVFEDRNHNIWFGSTANGVSRLNETHKNFETYSSNKGNKERLSKNCVWSITEDNDETIWVGTEYDLNRLDKGSNTFKAYKSKYMGNINSLVFIDKTKTLIIGNEGYGVQQLSKTTDIITRAKINSKLSHVKHVRKIFKDSNGFYWIGTITGIDVMNESLEIIFHIESSKKDSNSISGNFINDITQDNDGVMWFATENGLNSYNKQTKRFKRFLSNPSQKNSINNNYISSLHIDSNNNIWAGTLGSGINKLSLDSETNSYSIKYYTVKNGLANNVVYGILEDSHNNLWISTNNGLSRFNKETEIFRNYDYKDGLQSNEFNVGAYFKSKNGYMYFGGPSGLTKFHPDSIYDNTHIPPVLITSFKVYNEEISLPKPIFLTDSIFLNYNDKIISIEFASLDFNTPEKNQFAYFLDAFDRSWNYNGNRNFASYTNLDPGEYTFRVKASNNDGIWNEAGKNLTIVIAPPFWQTSWFRILLVVILIYSAYQFSVYRTKKIQIEKDKLEKIVLMRTEQLKDYADKIEKTNRKLIKVNEQKTELLDMTVHDLKNPLISISFSASAIQETLDNQEFIVKKTYSILTITEKMLSIINNLLNKNAKESESFELDKQMIDLRLLLENLIESQTFIANKKNIKFKFSTESNNYTIFADEERIIELFENLIGNAIKFSPADKSVFISLSKTDTQIVRVSIKDQGPGFRAEDLSKIFRKYQRLSAQPTGGETSTGLGLSIVKQLVELHDGTISVESEFGSGAEFIVELPINSTFS